MITFFVLPWHKCPILWSSSTCFVLYDIYMHSKILLLCRFKDIFPWKGNKLADQLSAHLYFGLNSEPWKYWNILSGFPTANIQHRMKNHPFPCNQNIKCPWKVLTQSVQIWSSSKLTWGRLISSDHFQGAFILDI